MKKIFFIATILTSILMSAQEHKPMSLINVSGEGKIKITPDQVAIAVTVESKGVKAADVKIDNDTKIDAVLKFVKKMGIESKDFQTQMVYLNDQFDYQKKKHNYVATQTLNILLRDITKYDVLMEGLLDAGVNNIGGITFKSSKFDSYKSEARKIAMKDAKQKADDFVAVLAGQKVGKAFTINDNSQSYYPQPNYMMMKSSAMQADSQESRETLAIGEIEVICNVSVAFLLE